LSCRWETKTLMIRNRMLAKTEFKLHCFVVNKIIICYCRFSMTVNCQYKLLTRFSAGWLSTNINFVSTCQQRHWYKFMLCPSCTYVLWLGLVSAWQFVPALSWNMECALIGQTSQFKIKRITKGDCVSKKPVKCTSLSMTGWWMQLRFKHERYHFKLLYVALGLGEWLHEWHIRDL
jgi:hypothetical protein